jgi:hypothetical protein
MGRPRKAGIGLATLRRTEQTEGTVKRNFATILKIQKTLEHAGIHFTEDDTGEVDPENEDTVTPLVIGIKAAAHYFPSCE